MSRFLNKLCPVCKSRFGDNDDIVVCPECGTPHHRACYMKNGTCALEAKHAEGFEWDGTLPDEQPAETSAAAEAEQTSEVEAQDTENAETGEPAEEQDPHHAEYFGGTTSTESRSHRPDFDTQFEMPDGDFTNPYAEAYKQIQQMTSDETRGEDGVSAKELSRFVGTSVFHYAQAFSAFRVGVHHNGAIRPVKIFLNLCAGLFSPIHQFYRRMDIMGILLLLVNAAAQIPDVMLHYFQKALNPSTISTLQNLSLVGRIVTMAIVMLLCVFGDYIYYKFCVRRIKKIRMQYDDGKAEGYYEALTECGTPSKLRAVIGILASAFVTQLVLVLPFDKLIS